MSWEFLLQLLCDPFSPSRLSKTEVLSETWACNMKVLFCERDDKRRPVRKPKPGAPKKPGNDYRSLLKKQGLPGHVVEEKVRAWLADLSQKMLDAARFQRKG